MNGTVLGIGALAVTGASWAIYWPTIAAMRVPLRPTGYQAAKVLAIGLAIAAFTTGPGLLGGIAAALAIVGSGMFLFFTLMSTMPGNTPTVGVGQPILDFTAKDAAGNDFSLASLKGTPFLLKFFRGHW